MNKNYKLRYRDEYVGSSWLAPNGVAAPEEIAIGTSKGWTTS